MDHWAPNSGPLVKPRPPAVLLLIPCATEGRDAEQRNRSPEMRAAALLFSSGSLYVWLVLICSKRRVLLAGG
jgi:hypothetical protein